MARPIKPKLAAVNDRPVHQRMASVELFPLARDAEAGLAVRPEHIAGARNIGRRRQAADDQILPDLKRHFTLPQPPPGVLPKGHKGIAQDQAIVPALGWGITNAGWSAFAEGTEFLGYSYLALLSQRAEYRVVSEIIAYEMTREWVEFKSVSEDESQEERIEELKTAIEDFDLQAVVRSAIEGDGFFGRGHIYIAACEPDDDDELKTSIGTGRNDASREKVQKGGLQGFKAVEAMWCYPTDYNSNNPLSADWYKPKQWFVMGKSVHHTRFLTLVGRPMPDVLKPVYLFGGLSMSQMIKPYVENWLRIRQSVADIVQAYSVWVLKTNLGATLNMAGDQLASRIELFTQLLKNGSVAAVDKDTEDLTNISAPLGTLDAILSKAQEQMASVTRIPLVKLLGIQPAGLNASSEGEIRAFYDWIKAFQESLLRDVLTTLFDLVQLHVWGEVDDDITFDFTDLWQLDEAGKAAIRQTEANTDDTYVAMGAITPEIVTMKLAKDPDSPYAGLPLAEMLQQMKKDQEEAAAAEGGYEPDPGESEEMGAPGGQAQAPAVKPPGRLASSVVSKAANFGGAASGGFSAKDIRLAMDHMADALGLVAASMDEGLVEAVMRWQKAGSPGLDAPLSVARRKQARSAQAAQA